MKGWSLLLVGIVLLLSGCMTAQAEEPPSGVGYVAEDAVLSWAQAEGSAVANSIAIRQVMAVDEQRTVVLASFRAAGQSGGAPALTLFTVERHGNAWQLAAQQPSPPAPSASVLTLDQGTVGAHPVAFGLLLNPEAHEVRVTWGDGSEAHVAPRNGSYLALGENSAAVQATALSAAGVALGSASSR